MATAYLRTSLRAPPILTNRSKTLMQLQVKLVPFTNKRRRPNIYGSLNFPNSSTKSSSRFVKLFPLASYEETTETTEKEDAQESEIQDKVDGAANTEDSSSEGESSTPEERRSEVIASLRLYREALSSNDEVKAAEIEAFLVRIEDEKVDLEKKLATLSEDLLYERDRVLRISADFDNFRKRTERERLSLVTNAKGEVVENLLPILDNFERAKSQIKIENEGEEKINNSYQSIYKQFVEVLGSLGVVPLEPIGTSFDPLLHEAIMREESIEFEEGIIIEEYQKGFKLGDRLLRPSMVKVSAGPGPTKPRSTEPSSEVAEATTETGEEGNAEAAESPKVE